MTGDGSVRMLQFLTPFVKVKRFDSRESGSNVSSSGSVQQDRRTECVLDAAALQLQRVFLVNEKANSRQEEITKLDADQIDTKA